MVMPASRLLRLPSIRARLDQRPTQVSSSVLRCQVSLRLAQYLETDEVLAYRGGAK